jgi:hypothetical protein
MNPNSKCFAGPQLSALAGATGACMVWLFGTLAIFALQTPVA